jgi:hypothetical protein
MNASRRLGFCSAPALLFALLAACSSPPNPQERIENRELAAVAPLKTKFSGVVMGFDIRPATTLIVSLDAQQYYYMEDDDIAAMKRAALARWRSAWTSSHPHAHAVLTVRFIDFVGHKIGTETTNV